MANEKRLGRIRNVRVGYGGYQDAHIGIQFELGGDHWGVSSPMLGSWAPSMVKHSENCKWTEMDRDREFVKAMRKLDELLAAAKKQDAQELVGVPVECEFEG